MTVEFVEPEKLSDVETREAEEFLFHVLAAEARSVIDDEPLNEIASPDIVQTIQVAVDKIVAKAKARSLN